MNLPNTLGQGMMQSSKLGDIKGRVPNIRKQRPHQPVIRPFSAYHRQTGDKIQLCPWVFSSVQSSCLLWPTWIAIHSNPVTLEPALCFDTTVPQRLVPGLFLLISYLTTCSDSLHLYQLSAFAFSKFHLNTTAIHSHSVTYISLWSLMSDLGVNINN
jgi:hypothetical protein